VVFPSAVPTLIGAVKVNIGLAWVGTVMGEFLVSGTGLGYLIIYGGQVFNMTLVMSSIVLLLIVSTVIYYAVDYAERRLLRKRGHAYRRACGHRPGADADGRRGTTGAGAREISKPKGREAPQRRTSPPYENRR